MERALELAGKTLEIGSAGCHLEAGPTTADWQ